MAPTIAETLEKVTISLEIVKEDMSGNLQESDQDAFGDHLPRIMELIYQIARLAHAARVDYINRFEKSLVWRKAVHAEYEAGLEKLKDLNAKNDTEREEFFKKRNELWMSRKNEVA